MESSEGRWGLAEFRSLASLVMESVAFSRLRQITFLGILSPRYKELRGFPISYRITAPRKSDRSRADHSFRVAWLMGRIASKLQLSPSAIDYAVMWGLLHDIATWPLSHTGEAAFSQSTETDVRDLRAMMILGSHLLPGAFSLQPAIKAASLDVDRLIALFDKDATGFDNDLAAIHKLIHSAITPDTMEGMYRSGGVFGVAVPRPDAFVDAFERDLISSVRIRESHSELVFKFWRKKSLIYSKFINSQRSIEFESSWSRQIQDVFAGASLIESLMLTEEELVSRVASSPLKRYDHVLKYKLPLSYTITNSKKLKRSLPHSVPVDELSTIFIKHKLY